MNWLVKHAEALDALSSLTTFIAIIGGGLWFLLTRQRKPRSLVSQKFEIFPLAGEKTLLRATISIENIGAVLISVKYIRVHLSQVLPQSEQVSAQIDEALIDKRREVDWPDIDTKESEWNGSDFEIEPGETDQVEFDFIISDGLKKVQIYSYIRNHKKWFREIGWSKTSLYSLAD